MKPAFHFKQIHPTANKPSWRIINIIKFEVEQLPQAHYSNNTFGINETRLSFQTDPPNG